MIGIKMAAGLIGTVVILLLFGNELVGIASIAIANLQAMIGSLL